jgi:CTP synthase (UTP-ammonia lyase)
MVGKYVELSDSYQSLNEALHTWRRRELAQGEHPFIESESLMTDDDWREKLRGH